MAEAQGTVEYRNIPEFPGYRVGDDGTVWSCWHQQAKPGRGCYGFRTVLSNTWKRLRATPMKNGYLGVSLRRSGRGYTRSVHSLVATTFLGPCPSGMECAHENGDKFDCRLANLRWDTKKGNHADRWRHGTMPVGEKAYNHKLTATVRAEILDLWANDFNKARIAKHVGISRRSVLRALEDTGCVQKNDRHSSGLSVQPPMMTSPD